MTKRLFLVWCLLSLVIGGIVFYIEMERVDDFVQRLAVEESRAFSSDAVGYINSSEVVHRRFLYDLLMEHMTSGHFLVVELYNRDKQQVLKVMGLGGSDIERTLAHEGDEASFMKDVPDYNKYYVDGRVYLRAYAPIRNPGGEIVGYFEGIYRVDGETMALIRDRFFMSLLLVVAVISITTVVLYPVIISLNKGLIRYSEELSEANIGMLKILGAAVAKRDSDTSSHSYRVSIYAIRLAEALNLGRQAMQGIIKGGFLHDVGKIAISDAILLKPGRLSAEEYAIMQTHVDHGVDLIGQYAWLQDALEVVRGHHERFDGSGYRAQLKGEAIPLSARIFCIADYFDALTSTRPYREEQPFDVAVGSLATGSGVHFDPKLVSVFLGIAREVYDEIAHADERSLDRILDGMIEKYLGAA